MRLNHTPEASLATKKRHSDRQRHQAGHGLATDSGCRSQHHDFLSSIKLIHVEAPNLRHLLEPQVVSNGFNAWDAACHFGGPGHLIR